MMIANDIRKPTDAYPPVADMWRESAGEALFRSITKSCPRGLSRIALLMTRSTENLIRVDAVMESPKLAE
jgi:hypothetical protein